jgi:hypothetical protein
MNPTGHGMEKLDEIVQLSILYDFYGELLSEHKKQLFEDYILNDLSLSEIAEERKISRQGVHDMIRRCSRELKDYESKLALVQKFQSAKEKLNTIKEISQTIRQSGDLTGMSTIETLADEILKEL